MSLIDKSSYAREDGITMADGPDAVREYVQSVTDLNIALCQENARLKKRVSNQRRELRRLCHAQALLKSGIRFGRSQKFDEMTCCVNPAGRPNVETT